MNLYNRYIPSPDGSYQKHSVPDRPPPPPERPPSLPEPPPKPPEPSHIRESQSIGSFLGNLLPHGLDTEDLIVVLLLLLMSENCQEDTNTPLITMMIYLFL